MKSITECILSLTRNGFSVSLTYSCDSTQPILVVSDFKLGEVGRYYIHSKIWVGDCRFQMWNFN